MAKNKLLSDGYVPHFKALIANAEKVQIASAWMTDSGALKALLGRKNCEVEAIIGIRGNATSPESLLSLARTFGWSSLRIADPKRLFHPKLVLFQYRESPPVAWIGSANFTGPGMAGNIELVLQTDDKQVVAQMAKWFREQWKKLPRDTKQRVARYKREWKEPDRYAGDLGGVRYLSTSEEHVEETDGSIRSLEKLTKPTKYKFQYFGEDRWAMSYAELAGSVLTAFADIDPKFLANLARRDEQRVRNTNTTKRYLSRFPDELSLPPPKENPLRTNTDWWMANKLHDFHFFQGRKHGGILRMACDTMGVTYEQGEAGDIDFAKTKRVKPLGFDEGRVTLVKIGTAEERSRLE